MVLHLSGTWICGMNSRAEFVGCGHERFAKSSPIPSSTWESGANQTFRLMKATSGNPISPQSGTKLYPPRRQRPPLQSRFHQRLPSQFRSGEDEMTSQQSRRQPHCLGELFVADWPTQKVLTLLRNWNLAFNLKFNLQVRKLLLFSD